jgi:hypothetical protein
VSRARTLRSLGVLVVSAAFLAGPTPGDVGGCGGSLANSPLPGSTPQQEYDYFEQGLCANLCLRLRSCGVLCRAITNAGAACNNDSREAYQQCIRGNVRRDIFGSDMCPHSCRNYNGSFQNAAEIDVQTCGHAVQALSCSSIHTAITSPPDECLARCIAP